MAQHPEFAEEQAYIDRAYACLDESREAAWKLRDLTETGRGGTHQARWEAEAFEGAISTRLNQLELNDAALVFGRIDRVVPTQIGQGPNIEAMNGDGSSNGHGQLLVSGAAHETFHIGRLAVSDEDHEPVVVDWRAPVAEPFYRATGRQPMGLARRRHFSVKGAELLGVEDELFGEGHLGIGDDGPRLSGYSTLIASLESGRTGQLGDIVATIQGEQDEIIRSPHAGVLVVQGGPGTGKTVVALHRAAYLMYTHRFPLEDQGVLVIGPNRLFLRYISRVLPSLGEAGIDQVVLADLIPDVKINGYDEPFAARVKGDTRMSNVLSKAVRDRERPLKNDLTVPMGANLLRLKAADTEHILANARRRFRRHNAARKWVEAEVFAALAASAREEISGDAIRDRIGKNEDVLLAFERMWPMLTPQQLLHDLFGSAALLKLAASRWLSPEEFGSLARQRHAHVNEVVFTFDDVALLDEARALLGPTPIKLKTTNGMNGEHAPKPPDEDIRTYGHIVVDEVQDLTPMQMRMCERRSLNGSMTVVGDIGQATGPHAPNSWDEVLVHLPDRKSPRVVELTVGYRIPASAMELAARVLKVAAPELHPPVSVRTGDGPANIVATSSPAALLDGILAEVNSLRERLGDGNIAVVAPASLHELVAEHLEQHGLNPGRALRDGLDRPVSVVPVSYVKGLELDGVVVVEPGRIVSESAQGMRSLYVALTRATRLLSIVHHEPLPEALRD
jgi:DNA helicase IV